MTFRSGIIEGSDDTDLADGKDHIVGLKFETSISKYLLVVDGQVIDKNLTRESAENNPNASFMIGVSVGKDEFDL